MTSRAYTYGPEPMRLWYDDVRRPPDESWVWARTNQEALDYLLHGNVVECSLDHDMGLHEANPDDPNVDVFFPGSWSDEDGAMLVREMIRLNKVPPVITIHSWNPDGAKRMAALLKDFGVVATVRPFQYDD